MTGYKLFRVKNNRLYPLYVYAENEIPLGVWLNAEEGPRTADGKVKSRLGALAFRPGWHLTDIPLAVHIGVKENGEIRWMHDNTVWAECEFSSEVDYQPEADGNGHLGLKFIPRKAMLDRIPENGFYRYKTNPKMLGKWIIAGGIKVIRVLTDDEVSDICKNRGYEPLPRKGAFPYRELTKKAV